MMSKTTNTIVLLHILLCSIIAQTHSVTTATANASLKPLSPQSNTTTTTSTPSNKHTPSTTHAHEHNDSNTMLIVLILIGILLCFICVAICVVTVACHYITSKRSKSYRSRSLESDSSRRTTNTSITENTTKRSDDSYQRKNCTSDITNMTLETEDSEHTAAYDTEKSEKLVDKRFENTTFVTTTNMDSREVVKPPPKASTPAPKQKPAEKVKEKAPDGVGQATLVSIKAQDNRFNNTTVASSPSPTALVAKDEKKKNENVSVKKEKVVKNVDGPDTIATVNPKNVDNRFNNTTVAETEVAKKDVAASPAKKEVETSVPNDKKKPEPKEETKREPKEKKTTENNAAKTKQAESPKVKAKEKGQSNVTTTHEAKSKTQVETQPNPYELTVNRTATNYTTQTTKIDKRFDDPTVNTTEAKGTLHKD